MGALALPGWVEDTNTILGIAGFFLSIVFFVLGLRVFATRAVKDVLREMEQHPEVHSADSVELVRLKLLPKPVDQYRWLRIRVRHRLWVQRLLVVTGRIGMILAFLAIPLVYYVIGLGATVLLDIVWPPSQINVQTTEIARTVTPASFTLISISGTLYLRGENKSVVDFAGFLLLALAVLVLIARGQMILDSLGQVFSGWV